MIDGSTLINLSSNDYLGLADDPRLRDAACAFLSQGGLGAGASRLVTGSTTTHAEAEQALAAFVGAESAVLFSTGYAANVGALTALLRPGDLIVSDALNHASLIDGARASRATIRVYPHGDVDAARKILEQERRAADAALVITDAIFSMDGDAADVVALRALCDDYDAALYVDEAHSLGVVGPQGRGLCAASLVRADLTLGTLGKAFGLAGAFVAASEVYVDWLRHRARSFVFSTAMPPLYAALANTSLSLVRDADDARAQLRRHANRLRDGLRAAGYDARGDAGAIVPVVIGDPGPTVALARALRAQGVLAQAIRPPTVPDGSSRLRVVPMATHSDADVAQAIGAFHAVAREGVR